MAKTLEENTGILNIPVRRGVTFSFALTGITGYGDVTTYTWTGLIQNAGDRTTATTWTVTATSANSLLITISATNLNLLVARGKYVWYMQGVLGAKVVMPLTGEIGVKEKGGS